jgi:hypothetical protein
LEDEGGFIHSARLQNSVWSVGGIDGGRIRTVLKT